jgi:thymidylate kinase
VLTFFLGTILPIRFTQILAEGGDGNLRGQFRRILFLVAAATGSYCLAVALFATPLLKFFYKDKYAGSEGIVALYAGFAFFTYAAMVVTAALTAKRQTRCIFIGNVCGTIVGIALSWPLIHFLGVSGAVLAMLLAAIVGMFVSWSALWRDDAGASAAQFPATRRDVFGEREMQDAGIAETAAPGEAHGSSDRAKLVSKIFRSFDRSKTPYCWLHGHDVFPTDAPVDVDCLLPAELSPRELIRHLTRAGTTPLQCLDDGAKWLVATDRTSTLVQLHVTSDYALRDRVFYDGQTLLDRRQTRADGGLSILPPSLEFACLLANRVSKARIAEKHRRKLRNLYVRDPIGCREEIRRFWNDSHASVLLDALSTNADQPWKQVEQMLPQLQRALLTRTRRESIIGRWQRRCGRWLTASPPCGLHVVFLGPDGVGKSTVIEGVRRDLSDAFLRTDYYTFAPSLIPRANQPDQEPLKRGPHALPPRSYPASLVKAFWWLGCYTIGHLLTIHPAKARSSLVVNHRYFLDAIVDQRRYRYSGPVWLLKLIWKIVPKPDLIILLDAPAEVIWPRKREITLEETARQRNAYRELVGPLTNARIVDASQPAEKVIADVDRIVIDYLAARVRKQVGLDSTAAADLIGDDQAAEEARPS